MKTGLRYVVAAVALAGLALVVVVASGCARTSAAPPADPEPKASTLPVTTVRPEWQPIRRSIEQPGQIEGFEQTPLYVKIAGYVRKLCVDIGDRVKAGQVLAELSVPELDEELHQKEAAEELASAQIVLAERAEKAAEANLEKSEAALRYARAGLTRTDASLTRWQTQYERDRRLLSSRAIDQQTVDQSYDQLKSAETALAESRANIQLAKAARSESSAQRDQARANVKVARARLRVAEADRKHTAAILQYARVIAPFDGVISKRQVHTGHFVQPPTSGTSNSVPLFVMTRTDPVRIFVDVPETDAALVSKGMRARIRVDALDGQEIEGRVTRSSWVLDTQARTLRTEIDLPNADGRLRPGMYATARITVERRALTLPAPAVSTLDDEPVVVRVKDGKAVRTPVKVGSRQEQRIEVFQKQTQPARVGKPAVWKSFDGTEEIVAGNPAAWTDGERVRVRAERPTR